MVLGSMPSALGRTAVVPRRTAPTRQVTCMAKKGKQVRVVITLECTEQKASGVPGMSRYNTTKVSSSARALALSLPRCHPVLTRTSLSLARSLARGPQNRRNNPDRMEIMKYNKYLKKHTLHREIKK